jgi:hypothetical protein
MRQKRTTREMPFLMSARNSGRTGAPVCRSLDLPALPGLLSWFEERRHE